MRGPLAVGPVVAVIDIGGIPAHVEDLAARQPHVLASVARLQHGGGGWVPASALAEMTVVFPGPSWMVAGSSVSVREYKEQASPRTARVVWAAPLTTPAGSIAMVAVGNDGVVADVADAGMQAVLSAELKVQEKARGGHLGLGIHVFNLLGGKNEVDVPLTVVLGAADPKDVVVAVTGAGRVPEVRIVDAGGVVVVCLFHEPFRLLPRPGAVGTAQSV